MNQTSSSPGNPENPGENAGNRRHLKLVIRGLMAVVVVVALGWTVSKAISDLREQSFSLWEIQWTKLMLAVVSYLATMTLSWFFWHRVMVALRQQPRLLKSLRAFFVSQLGKYVPGKAMVIVLRTDLVRDENVAVAPAAASVFVETLTWIFVGASIASLLIVLQFDEFRGLQVAALIMMVSAGTLTWPPVFNRVASKMTGAQTSGVTYSVDFSTMVLGWLLLTIGWCLNGMSLWLVVDSLPGTDAQLDHFPLVLAAVTLATVGGFVSLLPGGLGVRELVMIPLLGSQFGTTNAVVAAIIVRFVWLTAEFVSSGIIYFISRKPHDTHSRKTRENG